MRGTDLPNRCGVCFCPPRWPPPPDQVRGRQLAVLAPQSVELLALRRRQAAIAAPRVMRRLANPVPDRLRRWFELLRQLLRRALGMHQIDHLATERETGQLQYAVLFDGRYCHSGRPARKLHVDEYAWGVQPIGLLEMTKRRFGVTCIAIQGTVQPIG
jgi:hypothetical protein